jgi:glycerophosphoryl diester phosphodiesterase
MWPEFSPIIFAHRGDSAHAPENTISAFKMAADKGAPAIELDVKLSADGHLIIIHDRTVDRTTNGHGEVRSLPLSALRELDAGVWFSPQFRGERIPLLEEVFETLGKRVIINVELTNYATPGDALVPQVVNLVKKFGLQESVMFSSFSSDNLRLAKTQLPEVACGLLARELWPGRQTRREEWIEKTYDALNPFVYDTTCQLVNRVHAKGKRVNVYTVNAGVLIKYLIGLGVDGIITDDPAQAMKILGKGT